MSHPTNTRVAGLCDRMPHFYRTQMPAAMPWRLRSNHIAFLPARSAADHAGEGFVPQPRRSAPFARVPSGSAHLSLSPRPAARFARLKTFVDLNNVSHRSRFVNRSRATGMLSGDRAETERTERKTRPPALQDFGAGVVVRRPLLPGTAINVGFTNRFDRAVRREPASFGGKRIFLCASASLRETCSSTRPIRFPVKAPGRRG